VISPEEFRAKAHARFEDSTIFPTRECFSDVVHYVNACFEEGATVEHLYRSLRIVHAICLFDDGRPYAHAWVERVDDDACILSGIHKGETIYFAVDRGAFHRKALVYDETRYTLAECAELERATGSGGPWLPEYLELVNDYNPGDVEQCCFFGRRTECGIYMRADPSEGKFCQHDRSPWRHSPCGICFSMRACWAHVPVRGFGR